MPQTQFFPRQTFSKRRWELCPGNSNIAAVGNNASTNVGTVATPAITSTNMLTSSRRVTFSTGTTAGALASLREAQAEMWRGNAAGLGGFYIMIRFGMDTLVSGNRAFFGIADVTSAPTNIDPLASTTPGRVGIGCNANSGNWQLINNITGSAPTVLDLGANFPVNNSHLLQLVLSCAPNDSGISYEVTNLSTGNKAQGILTTNIPSTATFMTFQGWCTNNATAASCIMAINRVYCEVPT